MHDSDEVEGRNGLPLLETQSCKLYIRPSQLTRRLLQAVDQVSQPLSEISPHFLFTHPCLLLLRTVNTPVQSNPRLFPISGAISTPE